MFNKHSVARHFATENKGSGFPLDKLLVSNVFCLMNMTQDPAEHFFSHKVFPDKDGFPSYITSKTLYRNIHVWNEHTTMSYKRSPNYSDTVLKRELDRNRQAGDRED